MRLFELIRHTDVTGISGTGRVAQGVQFDSGHCVIEWLTEVNSMCVYQSVDDVIKIHGHQGSTRLIWIAENDDPYENTDRREWVD